MTESRSYAQMNWIKKPSVGSNLQQQLKCSWLPITLLMPRHMISVGHEWMNEIPAVPDCCLAKSQPRDRA